MTKSKNMMDNNYGVFVFIWGDYKFNLHCIAISDVPLTTAEWVRDYIKHSVSGDYLTIVLSQNSRFYIKEPPPVTYKTIDEMLLGLVVISNKIYW